MKFKIKLFNGKIIQYLELIYLCILNYNRSATFEIDVTLFNFILAFIYVANSYQKLQFSFIYIYTFMYKNYFFIKYVSN